MDAVRIQPEHARYSPGETVMLILVNVGGEDLRFIPCPAVLQRRVATAWVEVPVLGVNCPDIGPSSLDAGTTATGYPRPLPATLGDGTYRYRVDVRTQSGVLVSAGSRQSAAFVVGR